MKILIKNGQVVTENGLKALDILIENDLIAKISANLKDKADKEIDATGLTIMSGLVDMHVHLREPGYEYKEDIYSGSKAAVGGGFTSVACMPNTNPLCDNDSIVTKIITRAKEVNYAKVYPIGAITKGSKGQELAEMYRMKKAGAVAYSDDGFPVRNGNIMRLALEYARTIDGLLISHCEDLDITGNGLANEGYSATKSGLRGISRVAEEVMVAREILLAEALGTKIHLAHLSTRGSVELVRNAKVRGVKVTCETCPHYFVANDSIILNYDTNTKVNPPIREEADRLAIIAGIVDGTIDCIVTDHAPHHYDEKNVEYEVALNGISGIDCSYALSYTYLVEAGHIDMVRLVQLMSIKPSELLGLENGLEVGKIADITICDNSTKYNIDTSKFVSKGKNNPFNGYTVQGKCKYTIVNGDIKVENGSIL